MPSLPFLVVALLPILCQASPINRQVGLTDNVFMTTQNDTNGLEHRVCSIDAVTYSDGETIPTSSPCEHCVCRPPGFACTITSCEYRPGCKAFRRSDQCCPEYQCECEKDGKIYQNGEKIMDNNNPCEVCYCQGGEIICAVIDCYWRNDCPPRYINDRCCPMYDHCPPPSAQGPIRHRLPSVPSLTSPISWHNLTQPASTSAPPPPIVSTEATTEAPSTTVSTTVSTTTTTTSELPPSSSENPVSFNEVIPESDNVVHNDEPVHVNDDVISESSSVTPVETTEQAALEEDVKADQQVMNDEAAENESEVVSTTQAAPSVVPDTVSSTVIDSTTLIIPAALELTIQATSVQPIEIVSEATGIPINHSDVEPNHDAATDSPVEEAQNVQQDDSFDDSVTTERQLADSVNNNIVAENLVNSDITDNEVNFNPTDRIDSSGLRNELENASDNPVINDEVATTVPSIVVNEISHDGEVGPNGIVRNDLAEASTLADLEASEDIVTTPAPVVGESPDAIYSDGAEATTPRLVLENEIQNDDAESVPAVTEAAPFPQSDDSSVETVTAEAILNDEPDAATHPIEVFSLVNDQSGSDPTEPSQQADATEAPLVSDDISEEVHISHDDAASIPITRDATERVSIVQDATDAALILQDDATEGAQIAHDDATESAPIVRDATESAPIVQDDIESEPVVQDATEEAPIFQDDATEGAPIAHDDPTESTSNVQDDAESDSISHDTTEGAPMVRDESAYDGITHDATEVAPIVRDESEYDAIAQDATEGAPAAHDDVENAAQDATESAQIAQDATESDQIFQDEEAVPEVGTTESSPFLQDTLTGSTLSISDIPQELIQNSDHASFHDDVTATERDYVTQATLEDEQPSQDATESNLVSHDEQEQVTESNHESHDEATQTYEASRDEVTEKVLQDEAVAQSDDATERNDIAHDGTPTNYQGDFDDATERVLADEVNTESPVSNEQSNNIAQDAPATESPVKPELVETKGNDVFDIILDDEVVPEQLEILNQVRDVNEIEAEHHRDTSPIINISPSSVETLLEGVRHADNDTVEILNLSVALPQDSQQAEESTPTPPQINEDSNIIRNDESSSSTDRAEVAQDILNDEVPQTSTSDNLIVNDDNSIESTSAIYQVNKEELFRNDDTLFRTDIFRHHLGVPHDDDETTTTAPIVSNQDEHGEVILSDEQPTTAIPEVSASKNKVQKVAEVVAQNNAIVPDSVEASDNKFRLELDIFRGSVESDIESADVPQTTVGSLHHDDITMASHDDAVTESNNFRDDATTPFTAEDILQDGEGSGDRGIVSQDEQPEVRLGANVGNDEPAGTTSVPRVDEPEQDNEIAQDDPVTTSYSFRTNLLNSLEEEVLEQQDANPTTYSSILSDGVEADTEGFEVVNDEATNAPLEAEANPIQDEVATESVSKLRSDLDISTELPVGNAVHDDAVEQSTSYSNNPDQQNDYVDVSTSGPSGFQLEYREETTNNDDAVTASSNDEPEVQDENVTPSQQVNELRSEPLVISAENVDATENVQVNDEINSTPVVLSDEVVTTAQSIERLRTDPVVVEQQTEAQFLNDDAENAEITTESIPPNNNHSAPVQERAREEIILPERGVPKIQPISPDMSRTNHHELRFDLQLPPERDNSWLSRAVNQFRRLALFGSGNKPAGTTKTRMQNHRFLLF